MADVADEHLTRPGPAGTRFREIRTFPVIDSTNRYLLDQAEAGAAEGLVAVAAHQSSGRGRRGRLWDSKPGASLLVSVLLRPSDPAFGLRASQALALAVLDACKLVATVDGQLKWPNDVLVEGRKLAGVLAEARWDGDRLDAVVVGAGINLNWAGQLPEALRATAVSLDEVTRATVDADAFLDALLRAMHERLARPTWLLQAYRQRCATLGREVRVERADETLSGVAVDVNDDGSLAVREPGGDVHTVTVGEVVHLRVVDKPSSGAR